VKNRPFGVLETELSSKRKKMELTREGILHKLLIFFMELLHGKVRGGEFV
jgi:hypothetical protein